MVDCVGAGAPPGGADDWAWARLVRYLATPAADRLDEEVRQELTLAITMIWVAGGFGALAGYGLGYATWELAPGWVAVFVAGVGNLITCAVAFMYLPESRPGGCGRRLDSAGAVFDVARSAVLAQARVVPMVLRDRRATLLAMAYFVNYLVLTGLSDLNQYWGQAKYGWSASMAAIELAVFTASPAVAIFLGPRLLFPSRLRYANSIALLLAAGALGQLFVAAYFAARSF